MKLLRQIFFPIALIGVFFLGIYLARSWYAPKEKVRTTEDATVLLEKIRTVAKLVTVEGFYTELYNYKDYYAYDWWIFRKKALLRVRAKVSAGYDLSNLKFEVRPEEELILVSNIPNDPEIISIDHQIDYYDISEGTFNSFSEADYNKINQNAKRFVEQKARQSELLDKARQQGIQILDLIRFMAENAGWKVQMEYQPQNPPQDSLPG